jgi:hypothetical protein
MALKDLTPADKQVVYACLRAISEGPFIGDFEFHARLGLHRAEFAAVLERWPVLDDSRPESDDALAINGCFGEVCYGVPIGEDDWAKWFNVPRADVARVYRTWAQGQKGNPGGNVNPGTY